MVLPARHNMVGRDRGDVAARGRYGVHDGDHRTGLSDFANRLVDRFRTGRRATGRIEPDDQRLCRRRITNVLEQVERRLVAGDHAGNADAGDMVLMLLEPLETAGAQHQRQ